MRRRISILTMGKGRTTPSPFRKRVWKTIQAFWRWFQHLFTMIFPQSRSSKTPGANQNPMNEAFPKSEDQPDKTEGQDPPTAHSETSSNTSLDDPSSATSSSAGTIPSPKVETKEATEKAKPRLSIFPKRKEKIDTGEEPKTAESDEEKNPHDSVEGDSEASPPEKKELPQKPLTPSQKPSPTHFDPYEQIYTALGQAEVKPFVNVLARGKSKELGAMLVNWLSEGVSSEYHARPSGLVGALKNLLQEPAQRIEIIQDSNQEKLTPNSRETEFEGLFKDNPYDNFYFQVNQQPSKITANRRLVVNLQDISDALLIARMLIQLIAIPEDKSKGRSANPYQIEQFRVLLNSNAMYQRLPYDKLVIYYKAGTTDLKSPYFDTNGISILEKIHPLVQRGGGTNAFFPFYYPASIDKGLLSGIGGFTPVVGTAWGDENQSDRNQEFATVRCNALAEMLMANGGLPNQFPKFKADLSFFFLKSGVDPKAPWTQLPEAPVG